MNKILILIAIFFTFNFQSNAQGVAINTDNSAADASAALDVQSDNQGMLVPRMTQAQRDGIASPATGLIIYNSSVSCLQLNNGTAAAPRWDCLAAATSSSSSGTSIVAAYGGTGCTGSGTINGTMTMGVAVSGVTMTLFANITQLGSYNISATQNGVTFSASGTFNALGCQSITLTATGKPTLPGAFTWCTNSTPQGCGTTTVGVLGVPNMCNPANPTAIVDVTNPTTGKTWMDRNLGATRAAINFADPQSFGSLYQWGRGSDGHQCVNRYIGDGVTNAFKTDIRASTEVPNAGNTWDGLLINPSGTASDWLTTQNTNLWQGVSGTNNPCPSGYRVPTQSECEAERSSWSSNNIDGAFASSCKFVGYPTSYESGTYWTSTINASQSTSWGLSINKTSSLVISVPRKSEISVRCIKN